MRGKLGEDLKVVTAHNSSAFVTTAITFGKGSIDTQGFKEALVVVNLGTIGTGVTLGVKLYENSSDDFTTAVPVTGGIIVSNAAAANGSATVIGNVLTSNRKRYLWVGAIANAPVLSVTQSAAFNANVILGKGIADPVGGTLTIDLE
jgi:hypothetical protein